MNVVARLIEPKNTFVKTGRFTNRALKEMIVPLFVEQLLQVAVGLVDTLMVSYAGEMVVSGVSLTNLISMIYLGIFGAVSMGGTVIVSQYVGKDDLEAAKRSAGQTYLLGTVLALVLMTILLMTHKAILTFLYKAVEPGVMEAANVYFRIMLLSLPAIALYNAGCAVYRSMGKTRPTMVVSIIINVLNIAGNAIGIFVLKAGARGVAVPSVIVWYIGALIMTVLAAKRRNPVHVTLKNVLHFRPDLSRRILHVAIPAMVTNILFSGTKVVLGSIVSGFGTAQIAANGVSQTIWNTSALMCMAMSTVCTTVIGQCMGAGETDEAEYYIRKLLRLSVLLSFAWNALMLCLLPILLKLYDISAEAKRYVLILVIIHNSFSAFVQPLGSVLSSGLRASGDVHFNMFVSLFCTVVWRLLITWLLGIVLGFGVIGTAVAMVSDWTLVAIITWFRFRTGKWRTFKLI